MSRKKPDKKTKDLYPAPFSLRLSTAERDALDALADGRPWGTYIKDAIFDRDVRPRTRGQKPVKDHQALAKLLGLLGQSRISQNINQLAKAVNTGSLPVNADVHKALLDSCQTIRSMRELLMTALGLQSSVLSKKAPDKAKEKVRDR